uniref:HAT C-terminal dimerisation domain-containing protein n=1 Tax=Ditylenchus dipsaci TaxID=166011 RepID=A0A915D149_9BILA
MLIVPPFLPINVLPLGIRTSISFKLDDWHYLAVLAFEVLNVPATSAPVERIFSQAGLATRSHRNRTEFSF